MSRVIGLPRGAVFDGIVQVDGACPVEPMSNAPGARDCALYIPPRAVVDGPVPQHGGHRDTPDDGRFSGAVATGPLTGTCPGVDRVWTGRAVTLRSVGVVAGHGRAA